MAHFARKGNFLRLEKVRFAKPGRQKAGVTALLASRACRRLLCASPSLWATSHPQTPRTELQSGCRGAAARSFLEPAGCVGRPCGSHLPPDSFPPGKPPALPCTLPGGRTWRAVEGDWVRALWIVQVGPLVTSVALGREKGKVRYLEARIFCSPFFPPSLPPPLLIPFFFPELKSVTNWLTPDASP